MRRSALATWVALLVTCAVAFVLRTTNAATVLVGGAVVLAENDPYYHMRRVFQILEDYPRVPYFDPALDHPHGAPVIFPPLFDLGIATLARLAGHGAGDRLAVERLAAFAPPLLGALTCLPLFALGRRVGGRSTGLLAAALLALVPAHIWYSRLGFVDHHVAVTLLLTALVALVLAALGIGDDAVPRSWPRVLSGVLATLTVAAGMLVWNGFLLPLSLVDAGLAALFVAGDARRRREVALLAAAMHLGAALLVLPTTVAVVRATGAGASSLTLSYLHVALLLAAGGLAAAVALVPPRRLAVALAAGAALAALLVAVRWRELAGALRWVVGADPFMGSVQEVVSIVRTSDGRLDLAGAQRWMSGFFLATPLLLTLLVLRIARSRPLDGGRLVVLVWSAGLFVLTLGQRRFAEMLAPALVVLAADVLVAGAGLVRRALAARGAPLAVAAGTAGALATLVVLAAFAPYHAGFLREPERLTAVFRVPPFAASPSGHPADWKARAASLDVRLHRALGAFAEVARRQASTGDSPPEAVMSPWPLGHKLLYLTGLPVVATPFGSHVGGTSFVDWARFFLATDEDAALDVLAERQCRWVVVDNDLGTIGAAIVARGENPRAYYGKDPTPDGGVRYTFLPALLRTMYGRLTRLGGSETPLGPAEDGSMTVVPALTRLRLVLDSASDEAPGFPKAYEVMRGATLVVHGRPGAVVRARYAYESNAGRRRIWETSAVLDARGEARLTVPYSSERPDLGQASPWLVESDGTQREVEVPEAAVVQGAEVHVRLP